MRPCESEEATRIQDGIRIAKGIAKRFHRKNGYRIPLADLEGEALEAVVVANSRFDPGRGAWPQWVFGYVRGYVLRFIASNTPTGIRMSSFARVKAAPGVLFPVGDTPNNFLDGAVQEHFLDRIPAEESHEPEGELSSEEIVLLLELAKLTDKEREVTVRRIMEPDPPTLEEIGKEWGVSRERVRQIEAAALGKLKKAAFRMVNGDQ